MKLDQLLKVLTLSSPLYKDLEIRNVVFNSKQVQKDDLFVAIPGYNLDGHDFIDDAVLAGALAVIGEKTNFKSLQFPYFKVPNARRALSLLAAEVNGHPYRNRSMIGITGTNGKTTTAYMICHVLEFAQQSCTLFSTVKQYMNGKSCPSSMTTQDAVQLQQWLRESRDQNVVMEVSSHGLTQSRVDGIMFDFALFTNLSHEHLDYHRTFNAYFHSKARLFSLLKKGGSAIINTDCSWGRQLVMKLEKQGIPVFTYGQRKSDTLELLHVENSEQPVFHVRENTEVYTLKLPIPGLHNIFNAMSAILLARRKSISFPVIANELASFPGVPGRLETFHHPNRALFVIDYAHTPDGLIQCLKTMNVYKPRRLVHVFGFRGGRDWSKWDVMIKISRVYCDETILTLDDLNEESYNIMLKRYGQFNQENTMVIADRTLAIMHAWNQAKPGDCIVITGKGLEAYQHSFELPTHSDHDTIHYLRNTN
jgi:UDP-N-acetylmuramoyl-L-alanyl-D-glutamate--2,6-diaminopimelate ligase